MPTLRPGPSCTRFRAIYTPCSRCDSLSKLVLTEPQGTNVELMTYHCAMCDNFEQFLSQS
jgi:hypothetical protein